ncbi:type II toxin-antitoxin system RelE/ParE family toxin [Tabrizicola sp.]|uniref:type II toxin-antitoxin system RelE/ParE family toxin n=1 Tax=Tabrizicola sp. TaxID=2005166 RepID=UPI002FDD853C
MRWTVLVLPAAREELVALPPGLGARMVRLLDLISDYGLDQMREPHVKHLDGKLWELRAKAAEGIARGLYMTVTGRRVVVLHVFVKKSDRTPLRAIALARARMQELD